MSDTKKLDWVVKNAKWIDWLGHVDGWGVVWTGEDLPGRGLFRIEFTDVHRMVKDGLLKRDNNGRFSTVQTVDGVMYGEVHAVLASILQADAPEEQIARATLAVLDLIREHNV